MTLDKRSFFIYGESGVGKSWLAQSVPGTKLVFDTEGGAFDAVDNPKSWDLQGSPPKVKAGGTVVVQITSIADMRKGLEVLSREGHGFDVLILDSAHELQNIVMKEMQMPGNKKGADWDPAEAMSQPAWGRVLNHVSEFFRDMRDLTRPDMTVNAIHTVTNCAVDILSEPRLLPLLQEGTNKRLPYWFDVVAFMFEDDDDQILQLHGKELALTKCRPRGLRSVYKEQGYQVINPNLETLIQEAS